MAAGVPPVSATSAQQTATGATIAATSPTQARRPDGTPDSTEYPLIDYPRSDVRVMVNTDNIGISAVTLTDNLLLAARLCPGLARLDLLRLQRNALDTAFLPASQRAELVRKLAAAIPKP